MKKLISKSALAAGCVFLIWFGASWADVILSNLSTSPAQSAWNIFAMLF